MNSFKIHQQLIKDTHNLLLLNNINILLHKNASIPWIILVPITNKVELFEIPESQQIIIQKMIKQISNYFISEYKTEKMNIAAIGNIVSQLHIHVIGRNAGDACWPNVVWGNEYTFKEYTENQLTQIKMALQQMPHIR